MPRTTTQLSGGAVAVQLDQALTGVGVSDWLLVTGRIAVQCTGVATSVTVQVERSAADPAGAANPAPVGAAVTGNPAAGMQVLTFDEGGAAWWRVRVTAITGASVTIGIGGRGVATPAAIAQDRSAPPRFARLKLGTALGTAGSPFVVEVLGRLAGSDLRLSRNPGGRWALAGTTLTGIGAKRGIDSPAVTEFPGTSGAIGSRETEFAIEFAHDPAIPAFVRPAGGGVTPTPTPTPAPSQSYLRGLFGAALLAQYSLADAASIAPAGGPVASVVDKSAGAVPLAQATSAFQPTMASGRAVFAAASSQRLQSRSGSATAAAATPNANAGTTLPDANGSVAAKGFTCTHFAPIGAGQPTGWWIGNDGRGPQGDTNRRPSLVRLSADFATRLEEILLSDLGIVAGSTSAQGCWYDASDATVYVACPSINQLLHVNPALAGAARLIGRQNFPAPNGLSYDAALDRLVVLSVDGGTIDGVTVSAGGVRWIPRDTGDWTAIKAMPAAFVATASFSPLTADGYSPDALFYHAATGDLWRSEGKNGADGRIVRYDVRQKFDRQSITLPGANALEGLCVIGDQIIVSNDAYFHAGAAYLNRMLFFTAGWTPDPFPLLGSQFALAGVMKGPAAPQSSTAYAVSLGNALDTAGFNGGAKGGIGIGFPANSAVNLAVKVNGGTTLTFAGAVTAASVFVWFLQVDLLAMTAALYVNGAPVGAAQAIAAATLATIARTPLVLAANIETGVPARFADVEIGAQVAIAGLVSAANRQRVEGDLAWDASLQASLAAGHPYSAARPA